MRRRRRRSRLPEGPELVRLTLWSIFLSSSNSFPRQRTCTIELYDNNGFGNVAAAEVPGALPQEIGIWASVLAQSAHRR